MELDRWALNSRFNLSLLNRRERCEGDKHQFATMSRRKFLGLSGATLAGATLPVDLSTGNFSIVRAGQTLHVVTDHIVRWTIDPKLFGSKASAGVNYESDKTVIWLRDAFFPGTLLPASFRCALLRTAGRWTMSLTADLGITLAGDWMEWLFNRMPATGRWRPGTVQPLPSFSIFSPGSVLVSFTPDWTLAVIGDGRAALETLGRELGFAGWMAKLNHTERLALDSGEGRSTTFIVRRESTDWPITVERNSEQGWSLDHDKEANLFDELRVEALEADSRKVYTAMLRQDEGNDRELRFFPGGGLFDGSGEPFHFALQSPRMAFSLEPGHVQSALFADLPKETRWAHSDALSLAFAASAENDPFSLLEESGDCCANITPAVTAIQCPGDQDCTVKLTFDKPRHTPFNWAKIVQPFEDFLAGLHLLGGEHRLAFDLSCGDVLSVIRPTDMLKLDFEFQNVRLISDFWRREIKPQESHAKNKLDPLNPPLVGQTELQPDAASCKVGHCLPPTRTDKNGKAVLNCPQLHCVPGGTPRVTVTFPPQHVQEQAFFHSDDDFDKPDAVQSYKKPKVGPVEVGQRHGVSPSEIDPDAENNRGNAPGAQPPDTVPVDAILSGETNLVFDLMGLDKHHIPFNLKSLLNWSSWQPRVADTASQLNALNPDPQGAKFNLYPDKSDTTSIELPYRLFLSPHGNGRWAHSPCAVVGKKSQAVELWHTRLAVQGANGIDETNTKDRTARAIYTPDLKPLQMVGNRLDPHQGATSPKTEKRYPLDSRDREEIVFLTSDFGITTKSGAGKPPVAYNPLPIQLDHLILSPLGGYLKSIGVWEPPAIDFASGARTVLTVEQWKHVATLGRDHYVRVVYKGYLAPFSHRASLVKVTERKFVTIGGNNYAILHQRMYIVVHDPRRDFPLYRQPNNGRQFPFKRVDVLTTMTPDLDDPNASIVPKPVGGMVLPSIKGTQSLFWPAVGGTPFPFRFRFWDMENNLSEASLPVVFGDASISQDIAGCPQMVTLYNAGSGASRPDDTWVCTPFNSQSIAFAPSSKPGDTRYDAATLCWKVRLDDLSDPIAAPRPAPPPSQAVAHDLYFHNLPLFYPELDEARVTSASIQRITGDSKPRRVKIYSDYIRSGFDAKVNPGEVVLQVTDPKPPQLAFGANGKTDQAGGLSSPDMKVVGFSRKSGAVGGTPSSSPTNQSSLSVYSKGTFNPADFFGGLTSAKLLGAVKLSDILQPLLGALDSNLGDAPRMVEQAIFDLAADAAQLEDSVVDAIRTIQGTEGAEPLTRRLATQAQAVFAAQDARKAAGNSQTLDVALAHAALIQAILAYGDALKTQLQDPALLLSEAAMDLLTALLGGSQFQALLQSLTNTISSVTGVLNQLLTTANSLLTGLADLKIQLVAKIPDPLPFPTDIVDRSQIQLGQLAPEISALLDLLPVCQNLQSNITQLTQTPVLQNLPGAVARLGTIGKDLLALQQGLGVLGNSIPTPDLLGAAKDVQTKLTSIWDTISLDAVAAGKVMDDLQAACLILSAEPGYPDASQVLQNLRQIQRTLGHIDDLRKSLANLRTKPTPPAPDPLLESKRVYRWLQRLQQLQRQALEGANALQKTATSALTGADVLVNAPGSADLQAAAVKLLTVIVCQADGKGLIEKITTFDKLLVLPAAPGAPATQAVEDLVKPILGSFQDRNHTAREVKSSLNAQLTSLGQALNSARASLAAVTPQQSLQKYLSEKAALAAVFANAGSTAAQKAAAQQAVMDAVAGLEQLAAARLQVYDLAVRYQNCVTSIVSWALFVADKVKQQTNAALTTLADSVNALANPLQVALHTIHDAGAAVFTFVSTSTALGPLLAEVCAPLNSLPDPPSGTPISQLLDDTRSVMADASAVVGNIQDSVRLVTAEVKSLANLKSLPDLIAKLPIPTKISFSYAWHPKIKSFEPVFLLDEGADFSITAKFEDNVLNLTQPTFDITAQLTKFSINLIGSPSFVIVKASKLVFTSVNGNKPDCRLTIEKVAFGEDMQFAQQLANLLNPQNGPFIEFYGLGIRAGFRFQVPTITMGAFTMMQLALEVAVQLSFDGSPLRCQIGISDQTHPFLLSAGIYGGGGFLQLRLGLDGVELLQGALEFGVVAAISIGPVEGSGYVVAGIYFKIGGNASKVCGFVHAHGHMDIFGLISMDIDVYVSLCYQNGVVQGLATFSVSVSILFFSETFTMQASYQFSGSSQGGSSGGALDDGGNAYLINDDDLRFNSAPSLLAESESFISPHDWAEHFAAFAA